MEQQTVASLSHPCQSANHTEDAPKLFRRSPSYLYRKGTIYYFRCRFTTAARERFSTAEIRLSLRTGFMTEARKKARLLRAYLEELLTANATALTLPDLRAKMADKLEKLHTESRQAMEQKHTTEEMGKLLNEKMREIFAKLLAEPKKCPPAPDEIRRRCNAALKQLLDEDAQETFVCPMMYTKQPDGTEIARLVDFIHDDAAKEITQQINTLEDINQWMPLEVLQLIADGYFSREEITEENVLIIAKIARRNKAILEQVHAARLRGDYSFEQQFYAAEASTALSIQPSIQPSESQLNTKPSLMLSEFIEKYKSTVRNANSKRMQVKVL